MDRAALSAQLVIDEGLRLKPYRDTVGKLTIGVGRNLDDVGITKAEAMILLVSDIAGVESDLDNSLPWWRGMSEERQIALANFTFNVGIGTVLKFNKTLDLLKNGKYVDAGNEMLNSKWASQVGDRAKRIVEQIKKG